MKKSLGTGVKIPKVQTQLSSRWKEESGEHRRVLGVGTPRLGRRHFASLRHFTVSLIVLCEVILA